MEDFPISRRGFVLGSLATLGSASTAVAGNRSQFNFGSTFSISKSANYSGKKIISYPTKERAGTIIIDSSRRKLFYILHNGKAIRYGVGVGRKGFGWSGIAQVKRKKEWPSWHPPKEMIEREKRQYGRTLPDVMPGGPNNPLGARALYLFQGSKDTLYRIHGTTKPQTIGRAVSSGCIRMINEEVIDLYDRVRLGTKVIVL